MYYRIASGNIKLDKEGGKLMEVAVTILLVLIVLGAITAIFKNLADTECPSCLHRIRSDRPDGLCRICRDPELMYLELRSL